MYLRRSHTDFLPGLLTKSDDEFVIAQTVGILLGTWLYLKKLPCDGDARLIFQQTLPELAQYDESWEYAVLLYKSVKQGGSLGKFR